MKSFQVSCKKFREERPWTRPSEKGLERKGSTRTYVCIRTHAGARGRKKVYRKYRVPWRWESASLPRPLEPVARENLLPPSLPAPAPWEWGGAVRCVEFRGSGRCRSFTTVPVHNALSTIFLSPRGTRPSPPICQTLRAARGENSRSAITAVLDYTKLKKEKDGSRVISHSRRIVILKSAGKEGRKEGRRFVPSCKEASFAGTILPPSSPPSSPIEPALSTRDVWRWRSLINSKDRPRPPCGKPPPSPFSLAATFTPPSHPAYQGKKKRILSLRCDGGRIKRERERREIHRSNRYLYLFLSISVSYSMEFDHVEFLSLPLFTRK